MAHPLLSIDQVSVRFGGLVALQKVDLVVDPEDFSTISSHKRLEKYRLLMIA